MFTWFRKTLTFSKAVAACADAMVDDDYESAKKHFSVFENSSRPRHIAMGGRIKLGERDYEGALRCFEKASKIASQNKKERERYVLEYCKFWISLIKKDGMHEVHRNAAHSLKPSRSALFCLPLATKEFREEQNTPANGRPTKFDYKHAKATYKLDGSIDFKAGDNR